MCDKVAPFLEMFIAIPEEDLNPSLCDISVEGSMPLTGMDGSETFCEEWLCRSARCEIQLPVSPPK